LFVLIGKIAPELVSIVAMKMSFEPELAT